MLKTEVVEIVTKEYLKLYKSWTAIEITEYFAGADGYFMVVKGLEKGKWQESEICFCSKDLKVSIFATTEELLRELDRKFRNKWYSFLFSKLGLSFLVIILSLVTLCILVFLPTKPNEQIIQLIGGALLAAVGFLFGSSK